MSYLITNALNAALLVVTRPLVWLYFILGAIGVWLDDRFTKIGFGAGPNTLRDWLNAIAFWAFFILLFFTVWGFYA